MKKILIILIFGMLAFSCGKDEIDKKAADELKSQKESLSRELDSLKDKSAEMDKLSDSLEKELEKIKKEKNIKEIIGDSVIKNK